MLKEISAVVKNTNPFRELAQKWGCQVNLIDCKDAGFNSTDLLIEVAGERADDYIRELRGLDRVKDLHLSTPISKSESGSTLVLVKAKPMFYCTVAKDSGSFCLSCPYVSTDLSNDTVMWKLLVTSLESMQRVMHSLEIYGRGSELNDISNPSYYSILTARQREILLKASEVGYFAFPRKLSLTELAEKLSISPATLSEILRSAESKIMKNYIDSITRSNKE